MASSSSSTTKVSLKLLIDTKNKKVLFAEASKPAIDFLFNLLCLPIGTVGKLLDVNGMVGSLGNLYESVENLDQEYMLPNQTKDFLLNPKAQSSSTEFSGFLTQIDDNDDDHEATTLYMCPNKCKFEVTYDNTTRCTKNIKLKEHKQEVQKSRISTENVKLKKHKKPKKRTSTVNGLVEDSATNPSRVVYRVCGQYMNREVLYIGNSIKNGFVKDDETFLVMDDLVIQPMATISSTITLLNNLNVKEIVTFQEKVVEMGMDEGIKLLKASLQSKMVLTNVFINKEN